MTAAEEGTTATMHERRRPLAALAAAAVVAVVLTGCSDSPDAPEHAPEGEVDDGLAQKLEDLGITLYLPDLRDSTVESSSYDDEFPGVKTRFVGLYNTALDQTWSVTQYKAPAEVKESVCSAINSDNTGDGCDEAEGWAYDDYEGSTSVYVLRGDTLLVAYVETEDDDELTDQTVEALLEAPEISAEDLARG